MGPELLEILLCQDGTAGHPCLRGPAYRAHSSQETQLGGRALSLTGPASGNRSLEFGVGNEKADQSSRTLTVGAATHTHGRSWASTEEAAVLRVEWAEWGWQKTCFP